jgi:hypothetical protein
VEEPEDNWNCKGEKWKFEREKERESAEVQDEIVAMEKNRCLSSVG